MRSWHAAVATQDLALLDGLLADEVVFRSPAVFAPQQGKALTARYLAGAMLVLGPSLRYVSEWHDRSSAVLEFEAELDGILRPGHRPCCAGMVRADWSVHGAGAAAARA